MCEAKLHLVVLKLPNAKEQQGLAGWLPDARVCKA